MRILLDEMLARGAERGRLRARLFGGASVVAALRGGAGEHLGQRNARAAVEELHGLGIPVIERDLGGERARKVTFWTDEGRAFARVV